jgi:hypothetical protein
MTADPLLTLKADRNHENVLNENGNHILPGIYVYADEEGTYKNVITVKEYPNIKEAEIVFIVMKGVHPNKFTINAFDNKQIEDLKKLEFHAGEALGEIIIEVIADNGSVTRAPNPIILKITEPNKTERKFSSNYSSQSQSKRYIFKDTDDYQFSRIGTYKMEFTLDISNLEYELNAETQRTLKKKISVEVTAGEPYAIQSEEGFILPAVSNTPEDIDKRSLWDEMIFYVVDKIGNRIKDHSGVAIIEIKEKDKKAPKLEGNLKLKIINGQIPASRISVEENCEAKVGTYTLKISSEGLKSKELEFTYFDDEEQREEQNRMQNRMQQIDREIKELESKIEDCESSHFENQRKQQLHQEQIVENFNQIKNQSKKVNIDVDSFGLKETNSLIESIKRKIVEKKNHDKGTVTRKAIYQRDELIDKVLALQGKDGIIGLIADLGFIDDEKLDKTISTLIGRYLTAVVVENRESAEKLRKECEKSKFALSIIPLDNISKSRELTEDGKFKFQELEETEGLIGYACNLIDLRQHQHEIRYVLYNIIGDTIVFQTYDQGISFRQKQLMQKKKCPTIITIDGDKLEQNGIVYAGKKQETKNRFGQLPITETKQFHDLKMRKDSLEVHKKLLKEKELIDQLLDESENNLESTRKKYTPDITKLTEELKQLKKEMSSFGVPKKERIEIPTIEDSDEELYKKKRKHDDVQSDGSVDITIESPKKKKKKKSKK